MMTARARFNVSSRLLLWGVLTLSIVSGRFVQAQVASFRGISGATFQIPVEEGRTYKPLFSSDLQDWQPFGDAFLPSEDYPYELPGDSHGFLQLVPDFSIVDTDLRVAIIGDSTVADLTVLSRQFHGWGQVFADFFQPTVQLANLAGPGIDTRRFLQGNMMSRVALLKPQVVMMQFGHIDDDVGMSEEEFELNLRAIVDAVREINAIPVLVTPVSRRIYDGDGNLINLLSARRESMFELSAERQVQLMDLNKRSADLYTLYGETATTFVTVCGDQCDDRSHFSRVGAYIMAGLAADEMPALLQAYRVPIEELLPPMLDAFENDRNFESLSTPFVDLTGFEDEQVLDWVFRVDGLVNAQ